MMTFRLLAPITFFCLAILVARAADEPPVPEPAKPQNGVFILATGLSSTVLELKDGRFRYWFETDAFSGKEPQYPLSGEYAVAGNTIILKHEQIPDKQWTFRTVKGTLTLWRPADLTFYKSQKGFDLDGLLRVTDKTAEEAWKHRMDKFNK